VELATEKEASLENLAASVRRRLIDFGVLRHQRRGTRVPRWLHPPMKFLLGNKVGTSVRGPQLVACVTQNEMEERMTKFRLIGAAAVLFSVLTGPAMAQHVHPGYYAQSVFCATREAGNPYSKYCDYMGWSGWRRRGGWDSSLDNACLQNPSYVPAECSFNQRGQVLFSTPLPPIQ
jgi:hypothetical protein